MTDPVPHDRRSPLEHERDAGQQMERDVSDTRNDHAVGPYYTKTVRIIAGRSLDEWRDFARRDDCLDRMVPSDLRELIAAISERRYE